MVISITLPYSKSETNRCLIIQALSKQRVIIKNPSGSNDSEVLIKALSSEEDIINCEDAGTAFRFMTAYLSTLQKKTTLIGVNNMYKRPIKILVEALKTCGSKINYLKHQYYPPLEITGKKKLFSTQPLEIASDISSQFISALLMIAPLFLKPLKIRLLPPFNSRPYINMTVSLMQQAGAKIISNENKIVVNNSPYTSCCFNINGDWSAASYFFGVVALHKDLTVYLKNLSFFSLQGDEKARDIYQLFGVETLKKKEGITVQKTTVCKIKEFIYDFCHCPDLAQTLMVTCAALNISAELKGLASLKIKETNRLEAMKIELLKFGFNIQIDNNSIKIYSLSQKKFNSCLNQSKKIEINTYKDHRCAMSLSLLGVFFKLKINDSEVVVKSFPFFFEELFKIPIFKENIEIA